MTPTEKLMLTALFLTMTAVTALPVVAHRVLIAVKRKLRQRREQSLRRRFASVYARMGRRVVN